MAVEYPRSTSYVVMDTPVKTWMLLLLLSATTGTTRSGTTVTVDKLGDMYLTPWWDGLTLGTGEHLEIDCGIYTAGLPDNVTLSWSLPNDQPVGTNTSARIYTERRDKNYANDVSPGAFSVITLHAYNLTAGDSGTYICNADSSTATTTDSWGRSITVNVRDSDYFCGFESPGLCGWTHDDGIQWYHHHAADEASMNRGRGLRYDHTYGPSKHSGHFLDIDIKRDDVSENSVARLRSPQYAAHEAERCLELWYILHGPDYDHLNVFVDAVRTPDSKHINTTLFEATGDNSTNGEWTMARISIAPQEYNYTLVIEADTCVGRCRIGTIAIDDVHIHQDACSSLDEHWPDTRLKVRLVNGGTDREGRLEVLHDGMWGSVCDSQFGDNDATVICNRLGYTGPNNPVARRGAYFGSAPGNYIIWLHKIGCAGQEPDIGSCLSKGEGWGDTGCTHDDDAAVLCDGVTTTTSTTTTTTTPAPPERPTTPSTTTRAATPTTTTPTTTTTTTAPATPTTTTSTSTTTTATPVPVVVKSTPKTNASGVVVYGNSSTALPDAESYTISPLKKKTGAALGVAIVLVLVVLAFSLFFYRRRKYNKKSKYIVFSNPNYHREHLPTNDISMDSPLTSSTQSILA